MDIKELEKLIRHEISWLRYYALRETRYDLTEDSNIYEDLISIGYTKRVITLDKRCSAATLTSDNKIEYGIDLSELRYDYSLRDVENNKYTPLEVYLILFPEKKNYIIEEIKKSNK